MLQAATRRGPGRPRKTAEPKAAPVRQKTLAEKAAETLPAKREFIRWDEDEVKKLADLVTTMRLNDPNESFTVLVNKAQEQLPENRRRTINGVNNCQSILDAVKARLASLRETAREVESMRARLSEVKAAEDLLQELSDEEVLRQYGDRVIRLLTPHDLLSHYPAQLLLCGVPSADLIAEAARRLYEDMAASPLPLLLKMAANARPQQEVAITPQRARLPKVVILGGDTDQRQQIEKAVGQVADLFFTSNPRDDLPRADLLIVWTRFVGHDLEAKAKSKCEVEPRFFHKVNGGTKNIIEVVQAKVKLWMADHPNNRLAPFLNAVTNGTRNGHHTNGHH